MNQHDSSALTGALMGALQRDLLSAIATVLDVALPQWNIRTVPGAPISPLAKVRRDAQLADALNAAVGKLDERERAVAAELERAERDERDKLQPVKRLVPFGNVNAPPPAVDPEAAGNRYLAIIEANPELAQYARGDFLTDCWCAELFIKTACAIIPLDREDRENHRQWMDGRCSDWLRSHGWIASNQLIPFYAFLVAALAAGVPVRRLGSGPMHTYFGLKLPVGREFRPGNVRIA